LLAVTPAHAGPPYLTDDPVPTEQGHWEIYAFATGEGSATEHVDVDTDMGFDVNYGAAPNVQLTATIPLRFSHEALSGWRGGTGDVELGVKYRFSENERSGWSAAVFPRAILPTTEMENHERTRVLLPIWVGKEFRGGTSVFGGGGYEINPGAGNRDFWQGAVAVTHDITNRFSIGMEVARQGPDAADATSETSLGAGAIARLSSRYSLLVSGGPTWAEHRTGYHFYGALGLNL
jgi:hypothetical protein